MSVVQLAERRDPQTPPSAADRGRAVDLLVRRVTGRQSCVITGPAGIGRTYVLGLVAERLARTMLRVQRLNVTASAGAVPFGALLELLPREQLAVLANADALGRAVLLRRFILDLDLDALLIDDLHLLDPGSAALVLDLTHTGVAVVATCRETAERADAVAAFLQREHQVPLLPFTADEVEAAAELWLGGPLDSGAVETLAHVSRGNPLALRGLLEAPYRAKAIQIQRTSGLWRVVGPLAAPERLVEDVRGRLRTLSDSERRWVEQVAFADQIALDLGAKLVDANVSDDAERLGWTYFDEGARAHRIRHEALRELIVEATGTRGRFAALRALTDAAGALDRSLSDAERIAIGSWKVHLGELVVPGEAMDLAAMTAVTAPTLCERFLRTAIEHGGGTRAELALAEHLKRGGHLNEAGALLSRVELGARDAKTVYEVAMMIAIVTGIGARQSSQALAVLDAFLAQHGTHPDLHAVRVALLLRECRLQEALTLARKLVATEPVGFASVFAGINQVLAHAAGGDDVRAFVALSRTREFVPLTLDRVPEGPESVEWLSGFVPATVALDVATALPIAQRNYDLMLKAGRPAARAQFSHLLGLCMMARGDVVAAIQLFREAAAAQGIWRDSWLPWVLGELTEALVLSGDLAAAEQVLDQLHDLRLTPLHRVALESATAAVEGAKGEQRAAARRMAAVAKRAQHEGALVQAFDAFYASMRFGDVTSARRLLALGALPAGAVRDVQRAHAKAMASGELDRLEAVALDFWNLGMTTLAIGAAERAATHFRDAKERVPSARIASLLNEWRTRAPQLVRPPAAAEPLQDLTVREREIVRLAAAGEPDRTIAAELGISVRTAQTHLARAFSKLGIHRRQDLRDLFESPASR